MQRPPTGQRGGLHLMICCLWSSHFLSLDVYPEVGLLVCMVVSFLNFENSHSAQVSPSLHTRASPCLWVAAVLTGGGAVSLRVRFLFPWWLMMLGSLSYTCWPLVYPLWKKCLFRSFAYFKIIRFFLWWMSSLYILDIFSLSDIWYAGIFSHFTCCLLILLMVSVAVHKFFQFDVVPLV